MTKRSMIVWTTCLLACAAAPADTPADTKSASQALSQQNAAAWLENSFEHLWARENLQPAPIADDAAFLRRIYLDLVGTIPPVSEVRVFLHDQSENKRDALIERLLQDPRHPAHAARVWRRIMIPPNSEQPLAGERFEPWLRERFAENTGYDKIATDLITARADYGEALPGAFYFAVGNKPEPVTAAVTEIFLGTRIGCAQCHDHFFAPWKQQDFWGMAAFFSDVSRGGTGATGKLPQIESSKDGKMYEARFLDGKQPDISENESARQVLARWVVHQPNFAATAVNRLWQHLFGRGLAHPVAELDTFAERPEILDDLAKRFVDAKYDVRWLLGSICRSSVYQRASERSSNVQPEFFTHMTLKTLTAEQVFDSLEQALLLPTAASMTSPRYNGSRQTLIAKLDEASGSAPEEFQAGVLQALTLMNGQLVAGGTDLSRSRTLRAVVASPFLTPSAKIEALYFAAVTRPPRRQELQTMLQYVHQQPTEEATQQAYADVFWALLNSAEFILNR